MSVRIPQTSPRLRKILSGGQTGVDRGALRAARDARLEIGGWCPPGRKAEDGAIPEVFPLRETPHERSDAAPHVPRSQRTEWNVRDADATLILNPASLDSSSDPGTGWTRSCALARQRPMLELSLDEPDASARLAAWLERHSVEVLNVAGPSEGTCPGVEDRVYRFFTAFLT